MQLAMSLTSYKNTIHIFKHTVVFFCLFPKAANFEHWSLNETLMAYQLDVVVPCPLKELHKREGLLSLYT